MDCRKSLGLTLIFLVATIVSVVASSGCNSTKQPPGVQHTPGTPMAQDSSRPRLPIMSPYQVQKPTDDGEKKQFKPSTLVAAGDFYARAAMAPERSANEREKGLEDARGAYTRALQIDPNYLPAQIGLARCYVNLNDMERAQPAYERALQISPNNAVVYHDISVVYLRQKNYDAALPALEKAISLDPENRQFHNTYGWALARAGRTDDAISCFAKLYGPAQAHYKLARMLNHMQQAEAAKRQLELALRIDPNLPDAREMLVALDAPAGVAPVAPVPGPSLAGGQPIDPNSTPHVSPIRTVIYQQQAIPGTGAMPQERGPVLQGQPQQLDPTLLEPQTTLPAAPVGYQLPPDLNAPAPRNNIQPAPEGALPVLVLPPTPRVR